MNHTAQNSLKASAYLLGLSVEELIDVLHNASKVKEIRTASGCPFVLPVRESKEESPSEVRQPVSEGRRTDTDCFTEPNYANADECKRAVTQLMHSLDYWQIEATYWHDKWLTNLKSEADQFKAKKAEVERLNTGIQPEGSNDAVGRAVNVLLEKEKEIARLKAECQARQAENSVLAVECDSLKAEVERLTKAGDELAGWFLDYHPSAIAWNAAKEGKQS